MESLEVIELFTNIDAAIEQDEPSRALRLILANFDDLPDPAPLRERAAASLAVDGDREAAVEIYNRVGAHYLNSGHPTRVLAVLKKIEALGETPKSLQDRFLAVYNSRSPLLDASRRHAAFSTDQENLVVEPEEVDAPDKGLVDAARTKALEGGTFVEEPPDDLPPIPFLSMFPSDELGHIVDRLELYSYDDLEQVSGPGVSDGQLLWVASTDVTIGEKDPTYRLRPGTLLGLHRLAQSPIAGEQEVYARSGSELLALSNDVVRELSTSLDEFERQLQILARQSYVEGLLENHGMFDVLPNDAREPLLEAFVGLETESGERLMTQDETSPGLFLFVDGSADVVRRDEDWEITVQTLEAGDVIGEMGLVSDQLPQTDVVVDDPGHLLFLPAERFERAVSNHPKLAKWAVGLAQERQERLESTLSAQDLAEISD